MAEEITFVAMFGHYLLAFWLALNAYLLIFWLPKLIRLRGAVARGRFAAPGGSLSPCTLIVAARNEAQALQKNLFHWLEQDHPNFRLLVVNDGSEDGSASWLDQCAENYPHLRVLHLPPQGKKAALAAAIAAATTESLVFTDADCQPASHCWLRLMAAPLDENQLVLGYGALAEQGGLGSKLARWDTWQSALLAFGAGLKDQPRLGVGRNLAYRRSLFYQQGGFEAHLDLPSGDDDLFLQALPKPLPTAVVLHPDAFTFSPAPAHFKAWWKQRRRHLRTSYRYSRGQKIALALLGASQLFSFWLTLALLPLAPAWVAALLLLRYFLSYRYLLPLAQRLNTTDLLVLAPLWEGLWATFTAIVHLQNALFGSRKTW